MTPNDRPQFVAALSRTFATYGKPLPDPEVLGVWCTTLDPFPIDGIARALSQHVAECRFAPVPADVTSRLPKQSDGRPEVDEAWAISLRSRDERDTVVWTQECAEAFAAAAPVLEVGDDVGARMAFKAAYARIVERNRGIGQPVQWIKSLGHDPDLREAALTEAVRAGRLQLADVRAVAPQLCAPKDEGDPRVAEANLAKLRSMVGGVQSAIARRDQIRAAHAAEDREFTDTAKAAAARRVAEYQERRA